MKKEVWVNVGSLLAVLAISSPTLAELSKVNISSDLAAKIKQQLGQKADSDGPPCYGKRFEIKK